MFLYLNRLLFVDVVQNGKMVCDAIGGAVVDLCVLVESLHFELSFSKRKMLQFFK